MQIRLRSDDTLFPYFVWALEVIPRAEPLRVLAVERGATDAVLRGLRLVVSGTLSGDPYEVLSSPRAFIGADDDLTLSQSAQEASYYRTLAAVLGSVMGRRQSVLWAGAQMVRGGVNRRLMLAEFLGILTRGQIGDVHRSDNGADATSVVIPDDEKISLWSSALMALDDEYKPPDLGRRFLRDYVVRAQLDAEQ